MTEFKPQGYREREERIDAVLVRITSYEVGRRFSCRIDNLDPGGNIARGMGDTREAAEAQAIESARLTLAMRSSGLGLRRAIDSLNRKK